MRKIFPLCIFCRPSWLPSAGIKHNIQDLLSDASSSLAGLDSRINPSPETITMLILDRSCLLVTLLCLLLWFPPCFSVDESDAGDIKAINEIMDWVRSNGGWISDKLEVRQIFGSLSGIFTNEALKEGEVVAEIPWHLIIKPSHHEAHWCEAGWKVRSVITKDSSQQNPYERYLASRSVSYAPLMWSAKSKRLLAQLFSGIPNNGFFDHDFDNECEGAGEDFDYAKALVLLKTRGEGESVDFLVPFEELLNHRVSGCSLLSDDLKHVKLSF